MKICLIWGLLLGFFMGLGCSIHAPISLETYNLQTENSVESILAELHYNTDEALAFVPGSVGVLVFDEGSTGRGLGLAATEFFTSNVSLFDDITLLDLSYSAVINNEFNQYSPGQKRNILRAEQIVKGDITLADDALSMAGFTMGQDDTSQNLGILKGKEKDFFRLVTDLSISFLEKNNIVITKDMANYMYSVPTEHLQAYVMYAKGRNYERLGDYQQATQAYTEALVIDPQFEYVKNRLSFVKEQAAVPNSLSSANVQPVSSTLGQRILGDQQILVSPSLEEQIAPTSRTTKVNMNIYIPID